MSYYYYLAALPVVYFIIRKIFNGPATKLKNYDYVKGKIVVITGSSAGIGKETAKEMLLRGATVIFACRDEKKTRTIINSFPEEFRKRSIFIQLDLASFESVRNFEIQFATLNFKIDILINNAGAFFDKYNTTKDGIESTIQCNHFSPMYLTMLLLKHMVKDSGRILNVSSDAHKFVKNLDVDSLECNLDFNTGGESYSMFRTYAYSKLANIYLTNTLSNFFEAKNIKIKSVSIHPGAVRSEIMRPDRFLLKILSYFVYLLMLLFFKDSYMGAQTTIHLCYMDYKSIVSSGYYQNCQLSKFVNLARDDSLRKRFMEYSLKVIKNKIGEVPEEYSELVKY